MPETYEMYQLLGYVKNVVDKYDHSVTLPSEFADMLGEVNTALAELKASGYTDPSPSDSISLDVPPEMFNYWNQVATAREAYRAKVAYYFNGTTTELAAKDVSDMIGNWLGEIELGMARAIRVGSHGFEDDGTSGIPPSYFSYEITSWELNGGHNDVGLPTVNALGMKVGRFPLFLEGPTRYIKTITDDKKDIVDMYSKVKKSGLRDEDLKMYYVSASLEGQSYDMGRMMAFAPGWLENQSIWMHMSYKYYLELLRGKLYDQFYSEMRGGGILPFMDPVRYGRSLMECSSFLASSVFPDPSDQGRGFSARLSGSTAEFLSMWKLIFIGSNPYFLNGDGDVVFNLKPAIPAWMFKDDDPNSADPTYDEDGILTVSFKLFAHIPVTYHNSKGGDLFDVAPNSYTVTLADGTERKIEGGVIPTDLAVSIRKIWGVKSIDAYF